MPRPKNPGNKKSSGAEVPAVTDTTPSNPDGVAVQNTAAPSALDGRTKEMKTVTPKSTRKPEIVKTEARSNLVPINLEDEIRRAAYLLSERRGFTPGHETEDWLSAEREVLDRYHQQSA